MTKNLQRFLHSINDIRRKTVLFIPKQYFLAFQWIFMTAMYSIHLDEDSVAHIHFFTYINGTPFLSTRINGRWTKFVL